MSKQSLPEVWMRGPVKDVPDLLQPVAHALLQAREEIGKIMLNFPDQMLWQQVAGMASPGFHLQHISGVLDRLFTYADGRPLTDEQLAYLASEGQLSEEINTENLVKAFSQSVDNALTRLKATDEAGLTQWRGVGRMQLPSTVIGLLVHAAEHTMRHTGQLIVTVNVLRSWAVTGG